MIELPPAPAWMRHALCAGDANHRVWFPQRGDNTDSAKQICARCPVREECLDYALSNGERFGIWGGLSERGRRQLIRQRNKEKKAMAMAEGSIPFWPVRPFELFTVALLRMKAWRWVTIGNLVSASPEATERSVRRLLERLESVGVVRRWPLVTGDVQEDYYQWNPDAPVGYVARLEETCADLNQAISVANANGANLEGRYTVPPVAQAPEECPNGHRLTPGTVHALQTGILVCDECTAFIL